MSVPELKIKFALAPETVEESFTNLYSIKHGFFRGDPGGFLMTENYAVNGAQAIYQLKPREDDVWLVTFPKAGAYICHLSTLFYCHDINAEKYPNQGTHWTSELLWLLMNNLDYKKASELIIGARTLFPE